MHETAFERLRRATSSYQESCILAAAAELDLFTAILERNNRTTASGIAAALEADTRGTTVLLDVLAASDYLVKSGDDDRATYAVAEPYRDLLDSRTPETFVPMIRHLACVQRRWSQLAHTVKTGTPPVPMGSFLGGEQDRVSFIWAMNSIARTLAGPTVAALQQAGVLSFENRSADEPVRFLDIGGASGTYTLALLQAMPNSRGTIFDLPVGIAAARKRFAGSEFESRVRLVEGDFDTDELPGDVDFAWISAIIHQFGLTECRNLFAKAFRALTPGGKIAVRDFVMDRSRTAPRDGALFGVNMLVGTKTGMVYTFDEIRDALEAAGFVDVETAVAAQTMSAVVVGRKAD